MCKKSRGAEVTWPQMKHAIMRNFGGLESKKLNPLKEFRKQLILNKTMPEEEPNPDDYEDVETVITKGSHRYIELHLYYYN